MASHPNTLTFTGLVIREGDGFFSLCPELDVASEGKTADRAKAMLREAVSGHIKTCFASNLPYLRPVPQSEDPRHDDPNHVVATFDIKVDFEVTVHV